MKILVIISIKLENVKQMKNLTLVIPAKHEKYSLPEVLKELKNFNLKIIVIIENSDIETFNAIKSFNIEIIYQK
jgi:cellulose synthase/poly-beta-1,6-N-acetylglucosamine synthase-like glycosyltransferase